MHPSNKWIYQGKIQIDSEVLSTHHPDTTWSLPWPFQTSLTSGRYPDCLFSLLLTAFLIYHWSYSIFPYKNFWKTHFYGIKFFLIPTSLICGHHSNHLYICNKLTKYSCARHNPWYCLLFPHVFAMDVWHIASYSLLFLIHKDWLRSSIQRPYHRKVWSDQTFHNVLLIFCTNHNSIRDRHRIRGISSLVCWQWYTQTF